MGILVGPKMSCLMGELLLSNVSEVTASRVSGVLWRIVIGLLALLLIAGGGAWLTHAGIDPAQDAQAGLELPQAASE
jgi:hypothetical protein